MVLAGTAATGVPLEILAYTPGRPLALQSLLPIDIIYLSVVDPQH